MKVELVREPYGDDLMVVNAARVSFDKESKWEWEDSAKVLSAHLEPGEVLRGDGKVRTLSDADARLIQFLARGMTTEDFEKFVADIAECGMLLNEDGDEKWYYEIVELLWEWRRNPTHWAPFAHPHATFRIKAPIFVARQLAKHQIGMTWSEVSRRYVDDEPEFYTPEVWRKRAENVKQGSSDEAVEQDPRRFIDVQHRELLDQASTFYDKLIDGGVCPEQARMVLPQSTMTEWIWTGSLYAWANVYNQRTNNHAQRETADVAFQIGNHMKQYFPVSWEALTA